MKVYATILTGIVCWFILAGCVERRSCPGDKSVGTREGMEWTEEKAVERVLQTLGIPREGVTVVASQVTLPERVLPDIRAPRGRKAWCVRLDGVALTGKDGARTVTNPYVRSLTVTLSVATGQVIEVRSPEPEGDPTIWSFPSVEIYEQQLRQTSTSFVGLPKAPPAVTFLDAIQKATGGFHQARQIIAYYVVERRTLPTVQERRVWMIHLWGIPPFPPRGGPEELVPVHFRNHLRSPIGAETGGWYGADTIPQPLEP